MSNKLARLSSASAPQLLLFVPLGPPRHGRRGLSAASASLLPSRMDSSPDENSSRNKTPSRTAAAAAVAAVVARTPVNRRAASAEPPSSHRSALRTPIDRTLTRDLLSSVRRGVSASGGRRNNAPTPHAAAARRALDQRRTALLTPGKGRRQSLREQRETPMGLLQDLGRVLATNTRPIASSSPRDKPSSIAPVPEEDEGEGYDDDDDDLPIQPRLSLPLNDDEEDSELVPPRSAGLEDDTGTIPNIELPMRAVSEQPGRYSGISFGSRRDSDVFDRNDDTSENMGRQSDFFPGLLEDLQARANAAADPTLNRYDTPFQRKYFLLEERRAETSAALMSTMQRSPRANEKAISAWRFPPM